MSNEKTEKSQQKKKNMINHKKTIKKIKNRLYQIK